MVSRHETTSRLLPKNSQPDQEREDGAPGLQPKPRLLIYSLALLTALFLARKLV